MHEFKPEYPGDNENRAWIRNKAEEKGFRVDTRETVLRLPKSSITILFIKLLRGEELI